MRAFCTATAAFYGGSWRLTGRHRRGFQGIRRRRVQLGEQTAKLDTGTLDPLLRSASDARIGARKENAPRRCYKHQREANQQSEVSHHVG